MNIFGLPMKPICLGNQTGHLAKHIRILRDGPQVRRPRLAATVFDRRLRQVIQYKSVLRKTRRKLYGRWKLFRIDEDIVSKTIFAEQRDSACKIASHQELVVRLCLRNMPEPAQFLILGKEPQPFLNLRRAKIDPAHNSGYAFVALRQIHQEKCFIFGLIDLDNNRAVDAVCHALVFQLLRQKIAFQERHRVRDPGITRRIISPEVLVRIDGHLRLNSG